MILNTIFNSEGDNLKRNKFLSRFFGIFYEEIIKIWLKNNTQYKYHEGRPTIKFKDNVVNNKRGRTLDFVVEKLGKLYIVESKCYLQYENYKHLTLNDIVQIERCCNNESFKCFLQFAENPTSFETTIPKKGKVKFDGAILIWATINQAEKEKLKKQKKLEDILSIECMINQLIESNNEEYKKLVKEKKNWLDEFFANLCTL